MISISEHCIISKGEPFRTHAPDGSKGIEIRLYRANFKDGYLTKESSQGFIRMQDFFDEANGSYGRDLFNVW